MSMAMDPPVSESQRRAMGAAAEGNSTLGIPKTVGEEFVGKAKDTQVSAAGVIFVTPDGNALFLRRSTGGDHAGEWNFPGGAVEGDEQPEDTARRESAEETGYRPRAIELIHRMTSSEGVDFTTFAHEVPDTFKPRLNAEHVAHMWAPLHNPPVPLHPGVAASLKRLAIDEAPFREEDHPRNHGQFSSGGGSSGGGEGEMAPEPAKPAKRSLADKVKQHAKTIQKSGKETAEYLKSTPAKQVISDIVKDHRTAHYASYALQSMLSHGTSMLSHATGGTIPDIQGLDPSTWHLNEAMFDHIVSDFGTAASLSVVAAKDMMRKVVKGLISQRDAMRAGPKAPRFTEGARDEDEDEDGIDQTLRALLDLLEDGDDDEDGDKPNGESDKPKAEDDKPEADPVKAADAMAADAILLAFDRDSVREYDRDGRMRVAAANISKANICPYLGKEIPGAEELGLDPEHVYKLLRHPEELRKAAPTFNGIQVLKRHTPVNADDHKPYDVIGTTGTEAEFVDPYLRNSLHFWAGDGGIDAITSDEKKQLSCGYHYRADMTPGKWAGEHYDGVMREIVGNHVALVKEGRAGDDVVVGDSMENLNMAATKSILTRKAALVQGALAAFLMPRLAADAKLPLEPILHTVTGKNFKDRKASIIDAITKATKGKMAKDASIEGVAKLLDALEGETPCEAGTADAVETDPNTGAPMTKPMKLDEETMDADPLAKIKAFLEGKISPEDMAKIEELLSAPEATDEPPPFEGKPKIPGKDAEPPAPPFKAKEKDKEKDMVTKPAMDQAIAAAVAAERKASADRSDAERFVRPWVGDLLPQKDEIGVLTAAATVLGIDGLDDMPAKAIRKLIERTPKSGAHSRDLAPTTVLAADAASTKSYNDMFPGADRIGNV